MKHALHPFWVLVQAAVQGAILYRSALLWGDCPARHALAVFAELASLGFLLWAEAMREARLERAFAERQHRHGQPKME